MSAQPLHTLKTGQHARIYRIHNHPDHPHYRQQLRAMGLQNGQSFTVLQRAPLGDPIRIQVEQTILSLRKHEAHHIHCEIETP